jgi:hypothetical protein
VSGSRINPHASGTRSIALERSRPDAPAAKRRSTWSSRHARKSLFYAGYWHIAAEANAGEHERHSIEKRRRVSLWQSFWDPKVLLLSLNYFGIGTASLGTLLFLPQTVKQLGLTNMQVGWASMIPYICGEEC